MDVKCPLPPDTAERRALWSVIATGLHHIEGLSPIEASILANLIRGDADAYSTDPHCVIAYGVQVLLCDIAPMPGAENVVLRAFVDLGVTMPAPSGEAVSP